MKRSIWIALIILMAIITWLAVGGFTTFAQFNFGKMRDDIVGSIDESTEKKITELGSVSATPAAPPVEEEVISFEDIPEDKLRDAIASVNLFRAFAGNASNRVRAYIAKIKIRQRTGEVVYEEGKEPWLSPHSEFRYSPFDHAAKPPQPPPAMQEQTPFLPPIGDGPKGPVSLRELLPLFKLRMTMKVGDEFIALGEVAGIPVEMREGESLPLPLGDFPEITITGISIDAVTIQGGGESLYIPFAGPTQDNKEKPFQIKVAK